MSKNLKERVADFSANLKRRREECGDNHKDITWYGFTPTSKNGYRSKVNGQCNYCLTNLSRSLNRKEQLSIENFRESLNYPMTI